MEFGAGRGLDNFIYLTVSKGHGGGAIINGELLWGGRGEACHVGHMTVDPKGPLRGCGNRSFWGKSPHRVPHFFARAREKLEHHSTWFENKESAKICAADIFTVAEMGDKLAAELIAEEAEWHTLGIINLLRLFNPDRIVIGGGMSANLDMLLPDIMARISQNAMPPFHHVSVVKAELDDTAGLIGAAMLAIQLEPKMLAETSGVPEH